MLWTLGLRPSHFSLRGASCVWGVALCALSWFIHLHTTLTPGLVDRVGRFKGSDYIQFYVMGSLVSEGRSDALYDAHAHLS